MQVALPLLEESLNREMRHCSFNVDGKPVRVRLDQILYFESNLKQMSLVTLTERYTFLGTSATLRGACGARGLSASTKALSSTCAMSTDCRRKA